MTAAVDMKDSADERTGSASAWGSLTDPERDLLAELSAATEAYRHLVRTRYLPVVEQIAARGADAAGLLDTVTEAVDDTDDGTPFRILDYVGALLDSNGDPAGMDWIRYRRNDGIPRSLIPMVITSDLGAGPEAEARAAAVLAWDDRQREAGVVIEDATTLPDWIRQPEPAASDPEVAQVEKLAEDWRELRRAWLDPVQVARHLYELLRADRAGVDPLPSRSERSVSS